MLIQTEEEFWDAVVQIQHADVIAVDTETTGLHPFGTREGDDYMLGVCVATQDDEWYFPFRHPMHALSVNLDAWMLEHLLRVLEMPRDTVCWHNATFDWSVLRREGWSPTGDRWWLSHHDTMTGAWMLDENLPTYRLKDLGHRYLRPTAKDAQDHLKEVMRPHCEDCGCGPTKWLVRRSKLLHGEPRQIGFTADGKERVRVCRDCNSGNLLPARSWGEVYAHEIAAYGAGDARLTYDLWAKQMHYIVQDPEMLAALQRERDYLHAIWEMVGHGIFIDRAQAQAGLDSRIAEARSIEPLFDGADPNSTPQLRRLLYETWRLRPPKRTATGLESTDAEALNALAEVDPRAAELLRWRKATKAASTYFQPMLRFADQDGRIHPSFKARGTVTGRASCSEPNLQTIPHDWSLPGVRECFGAAPGFELWEYDLEQAELRVAAEYAGEQVMREHLGTGDLHTQTAIRIFGKSDGGFRRMAKNLNFAFLYEVGPAKFAQMCRAGGEDGVDEAVARTLLRRYDETYPALKRASRYAAQVAEERGFVKLWSPGRYRRYAGPTIQHRPKYYTAFNAIVQGGVGEIVVSMILLLREPAQEYGVRLVLQVHDALVYEIPEGLEPIWTPIVRAAAAEANPFTIEMPVGAKAWKPPTEADSSPSQDPLVLAS